MEDNTLVKSSFSAFTPTGRTKIGVIWDLSVKKIDDETLSSQIRFTALPRRNSWTSSANREFRGRSSRLLVNRFQRLITGRRRPSSQKVSNVMP